MEGDRDRKDIMLDVDGPTPLGRYLYHYTRSDSASHILDGMSLRVSPYSSTNDPRESRPWLPSLSLPDEAHMSADEWQEFCDGVDVVMRGRVQVACFTGDRAAASLAGFWNFHRGWARARMWQQYAGDHSGLCLILDRQRWCDGVDSICVQMAGSLGDKRWKAVHGAVVYEDRPVGWDPRTLDFSLADVRRYGAASLAQSRVEANYHVLYLNKNTDWQSECEFRSLVVGADEPLLISLKPCLVGIVVGEKASSEMVDAAKSAMSSIGCGDAIARCVWRGGAPIVVPVT